MTLITFPTRVHFSDGVLDEALRSELETRGHNGIVSLLEQRHHDTDAYERFRAGIPRGVRHSAVSVLPSDSKQDTVVKVNESIGQKPPDVIIAFGSARAIAHGRKVQHVLCGDSVDTRFGCARPINLFAIPGVDGMPNPCRSSFKPSLLLGDASSRSGLPNVIICDPTLLSGVEQDDIVSAAMDAFSRCLEAILSIAYNPPADGMAVDGLVRAASLLQPRASYCAPAYRELMAACLNAFLAQQKGIGPTQLLGDVLREPHGDRFLAGALARALLPVVLEDRGIDHARLEPLCRLLGIDPNQHLVDQIGTLLDRLPFPRTLSEQGMTVDDIDRASTQLTALDCGVFFQPNGGPESIIRSAF